MKTDIQLRAARRFAEALFNVRNAEIREDFFWRCAEAAQSLSENQYTLFLLALPGTSSIDQRAMAQRLADHYKLPSFMVDLIVLMLERHSIELLPAVLYSCTVLYQERRNAYYFDVQSSLPLNEGQQEILRRFLKKSAADKEVLIDYSTNKKLIAGVRAINYTLQWENSVAQKIRALKTSISR